MTDQQALHQYAERRDAEAFRLLVEQYQNLVYSAAGRRLAHVHDIEDVVQLTFLKLAKAAGTIRRDLAGWLYVTTINTANDLIRRDQSRRRHEALAAPAESFTEDTEREEWRKLSLLIDEVLLELPKPQQLLIVEHFLRSRSQRDLAGELNVTQPTILRRINAAIDELRTRLGKHGYVAAAPILASTLAKIPQPVIPVMVTAELAKIGLVGPSAVSGSALFAGSLIFKIAVGVAALIALFVGTVFLLPSKVTSSSANGSPASQPAARPADTGDWRARFNDAYALLPNQNLKFIPPPPLAERQRYFHEVEHDDTPMPFIQWRWTNGRLKREMMNSSGPDGASLGIVLSTCAGLDGDHVSSDGLATINANGDWIVRDGASTEAIFTDLHTILIERFKIDVRFEKNDIIKDAIIASGNYHFRRLPEATMRGIQVFADVLDHPKNGDRIQGGGTTDPAEFWSILSGVFGIPIVDEAKHEPKHLDWFLSFSINNANTDPARRGMILANLAKQTDLVFTEGEHTFTVWKVTPASGENVTTQRSSIENSN